MDPNEALTDLRGLVKEAADRHDLDECDSGCEWSESFSALDEWLSRGGFLPEPWAQSREAQS